MATVGRVLSTPGRWARAAVSVLASLSLLLTVVPPAFASCVPGRAHDNNAHYDGVFPLRTSINGVHATIFEYDPYYSGSNLTGTNMSVMLDHGSNYAQVGWTKEAYHTGHIARYVWTEGWDGSGHEFLNFLAPKTIGTFTTYQVTYTSASDHFDWWVNGTDIGSMGANWAPNQAQIFGETHDHADQMPGGTGSVAVFDTVETRIGTSWSHVSDTPSTEPIYGASNNNNLFIWDKACSS